MRLPLVNTIILLNTSPSILRDVTKERKMPEPMEIDFLPMPSWVLVSTNNSGSNNILPIEPIKLHSVPEWGHTLINQLYHTAVKINSLYCQIQGNETEAYYMFMQIQDDYHKIESNLNLAIAYAQQHTADAIGAHFNLMTTQFAEVAATYIALRRHVEMITISTTKNKEWRQKLLQDFAEQIEANQNIWIIYYKDQVAKQEKINNDCQWWASDMNVQEDKARAD
jgi:hypothetical protein